LTYSNASIPHKHWVYLSKLFIVGNFFDFSSLPFVMLRCAISIKLSSLHHHS
jgi:hypothetical protein